MKRKLHSPLPFLLALAMTSGAANAAAVIYETFLDSNSTLNGNSPDPGSGLSGTWVATGNVESGSLSYGDLQTTSGGNKATFTNQYGAISVGSTLSDAGLLADGEELWFSFLVRTGSDVATNGDLGFVLGTDRIGSGNNIPIQNGGTGLGVRFKNNQLRAAEWAPGISQSSGTGGSAPNSTLMLVAGRFTWGATSDTLDVYSVGTDLTLTLTSTRTTAANYDQTLFDTISIGSKASGTNLHLFDEIRFGATMNDVLPIPEPSAALLGGLGFLALFRRRR